MSLDQSINVEESPLHLENTVGVRASLKRKSPSSFPADGDAHIAPDAKKQKTESPSNGLPANCFELRRYEVDRLQANIPVFGKSLQTIFNAVKLFLYKMSDNQIAFNYVVISEEAEVILYCDTNDADSADKLCDKFCHVLQALLSILDDYWCRSATSSMDLAVAFWMLTFLGAPLAVRDGVDQFLKEVVNFKNASVFNYPIIEDNKDKSVVQRTITQVQYRDDDDYKYVIDILQPEGICFHFQRVADGDDCELPNADYNLFTSEVWTPDSSQKFKRQLQDEKTHLCKGIFVECTHQCTS